MTEKTVTISELLHASDALTKIVSSGGKFPIGTAYRIAKLDAAVKDAEKFALERMGEVVDLEKNELTKDERSLLELMMSSQIRLDLPTLTEDDLLTCEGVNTCVSEIGWLLPIMS